MSYDLLRADLQKGFRALAVFPDSLDAAGAAAVWEAEPNVAEEALGELLEYSLLDFNSASGRYRLHDLVRVFAEARLKSAERTAAQKRHAEHYKKVLAAADELYLKGGESVTKGLALFDLEWGNIQAGQAWAAAHANEDKAAAQLCTEYPDAGVYCLSLRLHPREWVGWLEAGLTAARQLKDRKAEGMHLGNLGNAYQSLGEYRRAIEYLEQHLDIAREIGDRMGQGQDLCNLGLAYRCLGEYRRAIEYQEQGLAIAREMGNRRVEGAVLGNLGNVYYSLGEYRRATEYYDQCLNIAREMRDRRAEGAALGNLGNAYDSLGDYRRAIECYEQRLQIAREIGDRSGEGSGLWNMSLTFDKLGDRPKAVANTEAALRILEQIESPDAAKVRTQLAMWRGRA